MSNGAHPQPPRKLLLVGWDSADWKVASPLIDAGQMPHFANLIEHGAAGNLASLPPYLSPMLWNSIATGKRPYQHGILGFASADPQTGQLRPMSSTQRRCKALWNILGEQGLTAHVVGWFASHPAENVTGVCVTEAYPRPVAPGAAWPLPAGAVHPPELAEALAELRVRPEEIDPAILRLLIPQIDQIDLRHDKRPEQLATRLAELYTIHNAAVAILDRGPWDFLSVYFHFIDWVCHDFMDFHPPRRPHIPEREYNWYKDVVAGAYRLQDLLLGDLLKHAGPGAAVMVCSDHGFHSDEQRPVRIPRVPAGIASWHRPQGLIGFAGPGLARDVLLQGASQLDVTPSILHYFGLPVGADMDGRVLTAAFAGETPVRKIPSWETAAVPHPRPRHLTALSAEDDAALLQQFAALGYLSIETHGPESPAALNERENRWNLAQSYRHAGLHEDALEIFEELYFAFPEEPRYAFHLALTQLRLGLADEAAAAFESVRDYAPGDAKADLLLSEIALARDDAAAALEHVRAAAAHAVIPPDIESYRGRALMKLERWAEAAEAFRAALLVNADDAIAWSGLARAFLRAGDPKEAEKCAREALGLDPSLTLAALTLAQALAAQQRLHEATTALDRTLALDPEYAPAHHFRRRLAGLPFVAESLEDSRPAARTQRREAAALRLAERIRAREVARARTTPLDGYIPPAAAAPAARAAATDPTSLQLVLVSGLPRSGTSLMMQMLARGGLEPMTDGVRAADEHNPAGYLEWEEIKNLPRNPAILLRASGRAVKIVSPLLPFLPGHHRYKIIFMRRAPVEVVRSQARMIESLAGNSSASLEQLVRHESAILNQLRAAPHIELLIVDYAQLVTAPMREAARVAAFLGPTLLPRAAEMPAAVRPELYRARSAPAP